MAAHKRKRSAGDGGEPEGSGRKSRSLVVPATPDVPAEESRASRSRTTEITNGPRVAVFMTTELLEDILILLPLKKIFVIQRVCRQVRKVVATSVKIQQKLFLRSSGHGLLEKWTMFRIESSNSQPRLKLTRLQINGSRPTTTILDHDNQTCLYGAAATWNPYFSNQLAHRYQFSRTRYPTFDQLTHYGSDGTDRSTVQDRKRVLTLVNCDETANDWTYRRVCQYGNTRRFTLGSLLDAALRIELDSQVYYEGYTGFDIRKTSPAKLLARLEKKTKKKATVSFLQIDMFDVLFINEWTHVVEGHA
ncbi:hypothetical protein LTR91_002757 [Friedmanniomyces endolithicus]|uniref:F-box domain-containing protein n=1 Tax=Friedmanniomyces endolithicus TaxID=329885 RepID=A0AAN6KZZ0_9PEZI|nr:hypothetical protein LTR35_006410 [Friedmanniomyces endolithicus]KAK0298601.1 hypothetical protein LTS00_002983 [Friedmanniomyces endolithicus]KAK0310627.1 hypothetical protein LTR01_003781 [Friedmanniomyces endolithicus]KAK0328205.1 hypothetical protein LTR82_000133 [Friedmanniomyces endolithicus]KAK0835737.1 hypothetical protein LTR73_000236 [Friedmanniomyces endolithicus]